MDIGDKIIYLRTKEKLSQAKLADIIFVSRQAISRWENGHTHPELETVKLLSKTFGYPLEWFLTEEYGTDYLGDQMQDNVPAVNKLKVQIENTSVKPKRKYIFPLKDAVSHLKLNKWMAVNYLLIALFPGFFFPKLLILTIPVALLALYTTTNRLLIGVLLSLTTVLTLLELLSLLTLYFNWFVQTDIQEVVNLILIPIL